MSTSRSVDFVLYACMLVGLSLLAHHYAPHCAATTLPVGIAGGVLSALLGVLGLLLYPLRQWPIVAMTALCLVLLAQAVSAWLAIKQGVEEVKPASLIPAFLGVFAVVQLTTLIQNRSGLIVESSKENHDSTAPDE